MCVILDLMDADNQHLASVYPLELADLSHPSLLQEMENCSQFHVSFFKTEKDAEWKGWG